MFPDWFQILQGSRVRRVQSTQTNDQNINIESGLSGLLTLASETHMSMPTSNMTSWSCLIGSDLENYGSVSAMQLDKQFSPSLLKDREPNGKDSAAVHTHDSRVANPVSIPTLPTVPNDKSRGHSLTRKSSQAE